MAHARSNGNGKLETAMTSLVQAQASLVQSQASLVEANAALAQSQAAFLKRMAELETDIAQTNRVNTERFARIEVILIEHSRILKAMPDAVRDKIGFKSPPPYSGEAPS